MKNCAGRLSRVWKFIRGDEEGGLSMRSDNGSPSKSNGVVPEEGQILLYTTPDGEIKLDVFFSDETVWLTQKKMALQ